MSKAHNELKAAVKGHCPLVYVQTPEEERTVRILTEIADELSVPIRKWTCVSGIEGIPDSMEPAGALMGLLESKAEGISVFSDLSPFFGDPKVTRALREIYAEGRKNKNATVVITGAELELPESLKKEVQIIEMPTPDENEIAALVDSFINAAPGADIDEKVRTEVTMALKGLTENEISFVLEKVCSIENPTGDKLLDEIFTEKKNVVKKSGFLEFSPPRWDINSLGGLDNLKNWLIKRRHTFSREALDAGVPIPKGLLMMGISGCGKSLAVKTISSLWNIPMFRLDMNLVFSGMYGSPEEAFHRAMKTIEAVAPAVLWIDEIENALGMDESGQRISSHIFSSFLTWMQEKPPLVFIAATANKIQAIPAEVLRKGRFDEVFFCDLPAPQEREEIMKIHLTRNGANPDDFDFKMLKIMTDGWNGAEIEQAVISARTEAFYENRPFNQRDLTGVISKIVPLSDTMEQQIKAIRSWAFSRATPASKYGKSAAKTM